MSLYLPYSVGSRDLPSLFSLCTQIQRHDKQSLVLDASRVQFVDPLGLAVLGSLLSERTDIRISMPFLPVETAGYMDRMDFFKHCDVQDIEIPPWGRNDRSASLTELCCITSSVDADDVAGRLADAITGGITTAKKSAAYDPRTGQNEFERYWKPIWYSLSELIYNSLTHAKQNGHYRSAVWIASQYYEKSGIVKLAVVDNGCGFLETLRKHPKLRDKNHLSAIQTALLPAVSCNLDGTLYNTHANQGVGLTTTAKIAKTAEGGLLIVSGNAVVRTAQGAGNLLPHGGAWNGVAIGFSCKRLALPRVRLGDLLPPKNAEIEVNFAD